ncbi:MAG TPA: sugar phosphate isomerase/epimerase family protein [Patescibacteria group bacterium]|nr:sugar phosphate isomerase/epimerase family protein [Patescibacteria group bacterium]
MNHPGRDLLKEIDWIGSMGFDFIDLTLEPPMATAQRVDLRSVRSALEANGLSIVGHTAYYLPLCSPFESLRQAAVQELKICVAAFAELGAHWMNLHPDRQAPLHDRKFIIERNLESLRELLPVAQQHGIGLMIENLPGSYNTARQVSELLDPLPELGLHLDIGHANLLVELNSTDELLAAYGKRLRHVHLHDNKGGNADLHLPLGAGTLETDHYVRSLQAVGYDDTITLEVFTADRHHLEYSLEVLRQLWKDCATTPLAKMPPPTLQPEPQTASSRA